jgi:primosomal protein N' (replication factor Y)
VNLVPTLVSLPRPLPPLTYLAPEGLAPGCRVKVRLRHGSTVGLVLGPDPAPPEIELLEVGTLLDPFPLMPPRVRELLAFGAGYYLCNVAHLQALALPPGVAPDWHARVPDGRSLADLRNAGAFAELAELGEAWHRGALAIPRLFHRRDMKGRGITEVRRTLIPEPEKLSTAQRKLLATLDAGGGTLAEVDLLQAAGTTAAPLAALERAGLVERTKRLDLLSQRREEGLDRRVDLNAAQRAVVEAVGPGFGVHLLYGVTGSGKTEVYLELAERALAAGRRVLWLVPEIGLTPRLLARLEARFPGRVAVGHAGLNASEKQADVVRLLEDGAPLFVGVRNAVLAPLRDVGLVIVDEEHEGSYKSEEHPRFHARDLAIKRAQLEHCPVVLGSATPSLESWQAAQEGRYALHRLMQRPAGITLPTVEIVDLREAFRQERRRVVFSPVLLAALGETLRRKEQAMLLLNRRGFENWWFCRACGKTLECPHCALSLTFHKGAHRLRCHLCGFETVPPEACPSCGVERLKGVGEGTERIEEDLAALFPAARILRLDRDTTRRRGALEAGLLAAELGQVDLLVGTQMLAKGHTFPNLTLVGVLNADQGLKVPDFRAGERTFQLLTQVAGRAGRADRPGRVLIQTYSPEHPAIRCAVAQDFEAFAASELPFRQGMAYPPYAALALLRGEGEDLAAALAPLEDLKARASRQPGLRVLGPLEAPVAKVKDRWHGHLLLKAGTRAALGAALRVLDLPPAGPVALDRDPLSFA